MYKHILIATDGSELADKGVEHGLALASALGAQASVLTVTAPLSAEAVQAALAGGVGDPVLRYDQQIDALMKDHFALIEQRASAHGVAVEFVHEIDDAPRRSDREIRKAERLRPHRHVAHGRRGAKRLILGSQTAEVVTTTTVPVLVVR